MTNLNQVSSSGKFNLRGVDEIPEPYRRIFSAYPHFNVIQSSVYDDVFYTDESIVVSAPTGSGKTLIFELALVKLLINWETSNRKDQKIVYIAPMKALCEERVVDWHKKFADYGISCICVTGDSTDTDFSSLINNNFIITTPEKWDSLTRKWRDNENVVRGIKLFLIDEIHLLNDETRGSTLEAIVTRMKTIHNSSQINLKNSNFEDGVRFVGVSATVSNVIDLAEWFGPTGKPAKYFQFEDNVRPVQLQKIVQGYPYNPSMSSPFKFDIMLSYKLHNVLLQHSAGKPSLIFCSTRKSVEMTAKQLVQNLTVNLNSEQKQILIDTANSLEDSKIKETLVHGVGCHHAGMFHEDRRAVENLFREGHLPVLVTTSTLAMGVNLPAHLVVIKSTKYYANGEYKDYCESMFFQMIGRAGRPQFDDSAVAVIMTTSSDKKKYENMINGEQPIESHLRKTLAEHVNAEVVLRTITDLSIAMQWLSSTFLYIRARKNPKHYGLPMGLSQNQLDKRLLEMCQIEINKLVKANMITIDQNVLILPTQTGYLMARYCVALDTMKLFTQVTGTEILQQILNLISKCHEFSEIRLRTNDKRPLNILNRNRNKETVRFPLTGKIKTLDMKINCVIQAVLGSLELSDSSLIVEAQRIIRIGERLLKCLSEYLQNKPNSHQALLSTVTLAKCFHARIWENSSYVSRQLEGIGLTLSNNLVLGGKTTFKSLLEANPRDLERILNKKPPFGNKIQDQVKGLPQYELSLKEIVQDDGNLVLELAIILENREQFESDITTNPNSVMILLVGDSGNNVLLHERYTHLYMVENVQITRTIDVQIKSEHEIQANFISEDWAGIDVAKKLILFADDNGITSESAEVVAKKYPTTDSSATTSNSTIRAKKRDLIKTPNGGLQQQSMDQYFKKVKGNKNVIRRRNSSQIRRKVSASKLNEAKTKKGEKNMSNAMKLQKAVEEITSEEEIPSNESNQISSDNISKLVNVALAKFKEDSTALFFNLNNKEPLLNDIKNDIIPTTPTQHFGQFNKPTFFKGKKRNVSNRRENISTIATLALEDSFYNEDKLHISHYSKEPKKKFKHESEEPAKNLRLDEEAPKKLESNPKSLTWRSPLVDASKQSSPQCDPKETKNIPKQHLSLMPQKGKQNCVAKLSISDDDCAYVPEDKISKMSDFISQSFLESLGLKSAAKSDNLTDTVSPKFKIDLNQTSSSITSNSNSLKTIKNKIVPHPTAYYAQILKEKPEIKKVDFKTTASQTDDINFESKDHNDDGKAKIGNVDQAIQAQKDDESNLDINHKKKGKEIYLNPKPKDDDLMMSLQRNDSWEDAIRDSELTFDSQDDQNGNQRNHCNFGQQQKEIPKRPENSESYQYLWNQIFHENSDQHVKKSNRSLGPRKDYGNICNNTITERIQQHNPKIQQNHPEYKIPEHNFKEYQAFRSPFEDVTNRSNPKQFIAPNNQEFMQNYPKRDLGRSNHIEQSSMSRENNHERPKCLDLNFSNYVASHQCYEGNYDKSTASRQNCEPESFERNFSSKFPQEPMNLQGDINRNGSTNFNNRLDASNDSRSNFEIFNSMGSNLRSNQDFGRQFKEENSFEDIDRHPSFNTHFEDENIHFPRGNSIPIQNNPQNYTLAREVYPKTSNRPNPDYRDYRQNIPQKQRNEIQNIRNIRRKPSFESVCNTSFENIDNARHRNRYNVDTSEYFNNINNQHFENPAFNNYVSNSNQQMASSRQKDLSNFNMPQSNLRQFGRRNSYIQNSPYQNMDVNYQNTQYVQHNNRNCLNNSQFENSGNSFLLNRYFDSYSNTDEGFENLNQTLMFPDEM